VASASPDPPRSRASALSLHDALPISCTRLPTRRPARPPRDPERTSEERERAHSAFPPCPYLLLPSIDLDAGTGHRNRRRGTVPHFENQLPAFGERPDLGERRVPVRTDDGRFCPARFFEHVGRRGSRRVPVLGEPALDQGSRSEIGEADE